MKDKPKIFDKNVNPHELFYFVIQVFYYIYKDSSLFYKGDIFFSYAL